MRNNETGEFELVVGNKQLLSGFFIVVLLFAVAFAMGYVVGQNTQRPAKLASDGGAASVRRTPRRIRARSRHRRRPFRYRPRRRRRIQPRAAAAAGVDAAARPRNPPPQAHRSRPPRASPPPPPAATGIVASSELPPGSYWQVIAVKPEVAEAMRQTLKDKGFPVSLTPGPNNLTRVLVGPYSDTPSLGRAKTELETAGFQPGAVQA